MIQGWGKKPEKHKQGWTRETGIVTETKRSEYKYICFGRDQASGHVVVDMGTAGN